MDGRLDSGARRLTLACLLSAFAGLVSPLGFAATPVSRLPGSAVEFDVAPQTMAQLASLTFRVPGARLLSFALTSEFPEPGMAGIRGRTPTGDRLYLFTAGSRVESGDIYGTGGTYHLVEHERRYYWVNVTDLPELMTPIVVPGSDDTTTPRIAARPGVPTPMVSPGSDGKYVIDVLVLYTGQHEIAVENERSHAQSLIFLANSFMEGSKIPVRYRLVGAGQYRGTSEDYSFDDNLAALASDTVVVRQRNQAGADVVVLLRALGGNNPKGLAGLATAFNDREQSDPPANVDSERDAFAVIASQSSRHVFAHELGHILGGGHAFAQGGVTYWKTYAHPWVCGDAGGGIPYVSLMTGVNVANGGSTTTGDFISNPDLVLDGRSCGQNGVPGTEVTEANNARSMIEAAPYVAAYRGAGAGKSGDQVVSGLTAPTSIFSLLIGLLARAMYSRLRGKDVRQGFP